MSIYSYAIAFVLIIKFHFNYNLIRSSCVRFVIV
jgi:hypothetical protein